MKCCSNTSIPIYGSKLSAKLPKLFSSSIPSLPNWPTPFGQPFKATQSQRWQTSGQLGTLPLADFIIKGFNIWKGLSYMCFFCRFDHSLNLGKLRRNIVVVGSRIRLYLPCCRYKTCLSLYSSDSSLLVPWSYHRWVRTVGSGTRGPLDIRESFDFTLNSS